MLRRRDRNGLDHAIVKIGERRLFLCRHRFTEWLENQAEDGDGNSWQGRQTIASFVKSSIGNRLITGLSG
jgi:hypothetical protein